MLLSVLFRSTVQANLWPFVRIFWHLPTLADQPLYPFGAMPRSEPLKGPPRQLQEAAVFSLDPSKIASNLEKFNGLLALPRFAQSEDAEPLDDLARARQLIDAITTELEQMKRPYPSETAIEKIERKWRTELIDGTYALTSEWRGKLITERRHSLIKSAPGPEVSMRTHIDVREREVHEELAERLSREPYKNDGLVILDEAEGLLSDSVNTNGLDSELQLKMLCCYTANWDTLELTRMFITRLIVEKERNGSEVPPDVGRILFERMGPSFTERECSSLLNAYELAEAMSCSFLLHPFLENLEAHETGRRAISKWIDWISSVERDHILRPFAFARMALNEGLGTDALQEIEATGRLDYVTEHNDMYYLISIGAILAKSDGDTEWNLRLGRARYWSRTQREQGNVPKGWVLLDLDKPLDIVSDSTVG